MVNDDTVFASTLSPSDTETTATLLARQRAARRNPSSCSTGTLPWSVRSRIGVLVCATQMSLRGNAYRSLTAI